MNENLHQTMDNLKVELEIQDIVKKNTLRNLIKEHPEYLDLPLAVFTNRFEWVGGSASVGVSDWWPDDVHPESYDENGEYQGEKIKVLTFQGN